MCGIAGIMTSDGSAPGTDLLERMGDALSHRGPDGRGRHVRNGVGLVQTRLAIIDLRTGDQPIYAKGRGEEASALVANGEIYNYLELRDGLAGREFATRSDCEPPLHLYLSEGAEFVERLRGMYAIAIHDPGSNRLVLARDPFGIKPLYFASVANGVAFASEPQALAAAGLVKPELNPTARDQLLQLQFSTGRGTAFRGVERILPGETVVIEAGRLVEERRLAALPRLAPMPMPTEQAIRELDGVLTESVDFHQRSDVPYAMFLSGGIDSSALLAIMARLNERPVRAYTAGFPGTAVPDERLHAREVARAAGAEHVEVEVTEADFWALTPRIAAALDDPAADYAVLPTFKLAQAARADGLKVVLCGEGGDELFAGYGRYRTARRPRPFARRMRGKGILEGLGILRVPPKERVWRAGIAAAEEQGADQGLTRLQTLQAVDCADWLPHDLLIKLDRCLMAHGVEGRVPFLDREVARFAFRLPDDLKIKGGLGKWILRKWLEKALPEARPLQRKRGFTVPVGEWIARRGGELGHLVAAQPGIQEACHPDKVERLFASGVGKHPLAAWLLLFFALWHRRHILGLEPQGDVFETLATG